MDRAPGGFTFFSLWLIWSAMTTIARRIYTKPALNPVEILDHLSSRGLSIPDPAAAIGVLETIGYFRLKIYCRALQSNKLFNGGASFDDVHNLYIFDRKLRLLCLDAVENLEVSIRASINNRIAVLHGSHFYLNYDHFENRKYFDDVIDNARKAKHETIDHYNSNYYIPELPPVWVLNEALSIGKLSRFFANLDVSLRKRMEIDFSPDPNNRYDEKILKSWFKSIAWLRNKCAHHNCVWNISMHVDAPSTSRKLPELDGTNRTTFYGRSVIIIALLRKVNPGDHWRDRLKELIRIHPFINPSDMGFPAGWDDLPFWN